MKPSLGILFPQFSAQRFSIGIVANKRRSLYSLRPAKLSGRELVSEEMFSHCQDNWTDSSASWGAWPIENTWFSIGKGFGLHLHLSISTVALYGVASKELCFWKCSFSARKLQPLASVSTAIPPFSSAKAVANRGNDDCKCKWDKRAKGKKLRCHPRGGIATFTLKRDGPENSTQLTCI